MISYALSESLHISLISAGANNVNISPDHSTSREKNEDEFDFDIHSMSRYVYKITIFHINFVLCHIRLYHFVAFNNPNTFPRIGI